MAERQHWAVVSQTSLNLKKKHLCEWQVGIGADVPMRVWYRRTGRSLRRWRWLTRPLVRCPWFSRWPVVTRCRKPVGRVYLSKQYSFARRYRALCVVCFA